MKESMEQWFARQDFDEDRLPGGHEQRFLDKLEAACKEEELVKLPLKKGRVIKMNAVLKWVVAAILIMAIGSTSFMIGKSQAFGVDNVSPEIAAVQSNYVQAVDVQLAALNQLKSPATERIIADAKASLKKLETDYKKIQKDFKANSDNPKVMDAMIQNLKNRILLLEDARAQIMEKQQQIKKQEHEFI